MPPPRLPNIRLSIPHCLRGTVAAMALAAMALVLASCTSGSPAADEAKTATTPVSEPLPELGGRMPAEAHAVLTDAGSMQLLRLDPHRLEEQPKGPAKFHGYAILGETELATPESRHEAIFHIYQGIADKQDDMVAACFNPRHGIRATKDGQQVDLVICYQCLSLEVYLGSDDRFTRVLTASHPGWRLNAIIARAPAEVHRGA